MIDLNDPDMREIVLDFCSESEDLIENLKDYLEAFEDDPTDNHLLEQFGQTIDRMMGAAKTIGAEEIGHLCEMGKIIGYKASQNDNQGLNEMTCGILFDLTEFVEILVNNLKEQKEEGDFNIEAFNKRLNWLADKFKHIGRASCSFEDEDDDSEEDTSTTAELEALIKKFGKAG